MDSLLFSLSDAVNGSPAIALAASLGWGILSVVLSPCHLSSIPLVVGFISGQGEMTGRRAFGLSTLFATGILVTIAIVGVITGLAGNVLGDIGRAKPYIAAAVVALLFIVGFLMLLNVQLPFSGPSGLKMARKGYAAAFILGLVFGIALGPCSFAFLAPVMGVAFGVASAKPVFSAAMLLAYAVGHCAVIALAGGSTGLVQRYLNWNERSSVVVTIKRICGALVILGAVYLRWTPLSRQIFSRF